MIVSKLECERPVAPGPPLNSVSPENSTGPTARPAPAETGAGRPVSTKKHVEPGEWPGVCRALSRIPATFQVSPPERSEEHTSELQSRGHLVCSLLLEK